MNAAPQEFETLLSTDERILSVLKRGPQTLGQLSALPDVSWAQAFLAIDRLSRSGAISLKRTAGRDYQVSLNRVAA